VAATLQEGAAPPAKTHIYATHCASLWGIKGMARVGDAKIYLIAFALLTAVTLAAVAFTFRGSALELARDFEECVEALGASQSGSPLSDDRPVAMTGCNARFARDGANRAAATATMISCRPAVSILPVLIRPLKSANKSIVNIFNS
jgi:hypothetical protein